MNQSIMIHIQMFTGNWRMSAREDLTISELYLAENKFGVCFLVPKHKKKNYLFQMGLFMRQISSDRLANFMILILQ